MGRFEYNLKNRGSERERQSKRDRRRKKEIKNEVST